ncbi:hypothetical protein [Sphaerisporangium sp. NPDC051011]|uniref:hypothetical protein n=1 Tax=Sphaerisporangium sp. NPDC051011 TaxID=3155792 RepID=UPI0033CA2AFF
MSELVPNPLCAALEEALRAVETMIREVDDDIERPFQAFHSGGVWTGPAAVRFDTQLAHYRTRVRGSGDKILSDLRLALARTPREVTDHEARSIAHRYGLS